MFRRLTVLMRLRTRLIIAFLIVMLIPTLEIAVYGYGFTSKELSEQARTRSRQEVYLQAEHITTSLSQAHGDALYLSQLRSLAMLRHTAAPDQQVAWQGETAQDLMVLLSTRPMYRSLRYLDTTGMEQVRVVANGELVRAIPTTQLVNRAESRYFQRTATLTQDSVFVSPFTLDRDENSAPDTDLISSTDESDAPVLHYSMKLNEGVIVIDLHVGWVLRNLPQSTAGDTWALIDQDGNFLAYPDTYQPPVRTITGQDRISPDLNPLLDGENGIFQSGSDVYVYNRLLPSVSTPDQFWVLYRSTPAPVMYASVSDFYGKAGLFVVAALVLAVVIALLTGNSIVAPILDLERKAAAFGRNGKVPALPDQLRSDEIGSLTRTFFDMAQELERKRRESKTLIDRLINAQEEERKLVAYDLHDGLIQQMVGARFYLTTCRQVCPLNNTAAQGDILRGCDALSEAITEGRRIIEGLRPASLDDLGLAAAIQELAHTTAQAAHWTLKLDIHPLPVEPDKTIGVTLYRIAQEALNNVRKHAAAGEISLRLSNGQGIFLTITDNGKGFDPAAVSKDERSFGITTMRERAELLGGTCMIQSAPGEGTTIQVWIPPQIVPQTPLPSVVALSDIQVR